MHSLVTARPHDRPSSAYCGAATARERTQLLFFISIKRTSGCGVSQPQDALRKSPLSDDPPENLGKFLRLKVEKHVRNKP